MSSILTINTQMLASPGRHTLSSSFYNKKENNEASIFSNNKIDENNYQTMKRQAESYELQPKRGK